MCFDYHFYLLSLGTIFHFLSVQFVGIWTVFYINCDKFWMNKEKLTRAGFEPATSGLTCRRVNPEVAGSNPALVNVSLFIQNLSKNVPSQFPLWFITWYNLWQLLDQFLCRTTIDRAFIYSLVYNGLSSHASSVLWNNRFLIVPSKSSVYFSKRLVLTLLSI